MPRHVARKRFGQHFLVDEGVIAAIVAAVDPRPGQALVEIGPGLGALTRPLLERAGSLTAIELDRDLAARWARTAGVKLIEADVLKVDFTRLSQDAGRALRMVGNLPYNISTPILLHLLDHAAAIADQHLMLQKEVGQRIAAAAGTKDYGRLSVLMQWRCEIEAVLHVPPAAFDPPPKVHSILLRIEPRAAPAPVQRATLEALVAAGFAQRRKLLRHMLGPWLEARGYRGAFDLRRRAEEVPVAEWVGLAQSLAEEGPCAGEGPG